MIEAASVTSTPHVIDLARREANTVVIPCRITLAGFPSQRVFRVDLADEGEYVGMAPREYFLNEEVVPLRQDQPKSRNEPIGGYIVARIIEGTLEKAVLRVSVPSGAVLSVRATGAKKLSETPSNVSLQS